MLKTLKEAFKTKDVRNKILLTFLLLFIYRLGCWLPIPGIDPAVFSGSVETDGGFLNLLSQISGGALANGSILALGVAPYINASIIIQLLTFVIPSLEKLSKQGDEGRKKINLYTRLAALVMSVAQAVGIVVAFNKSGSLFNNIFPGAPIILTQVIVIAVLIAGGMFTLWLGEKITEIGVGNGLSLVLFVGILSTAGMSIWGAITGGTQAWTIIVFVVAVLVIFALIVFIDLAERKIPVQYANQMRGRKMYGGQSTHIPMKINASGVLPIIFTMALISFPQMIASIVSPSGGFANWWGKWLGAGSWVYIVASSVLILGFSFFYAQLSFQPDEIARNIQQNGGFIPGIRPGKPTADYLKKISNRITLFGAIFLAFIALVPALIFKGVGGDSVLVNSFSATGMLIVVSVALEFDKQLESQLVMKNYKGFLK